jgi:polar amino acid transport system substrate-binding protein
LTVFALLATLTAGPVFSAEILSTCVDAQPHPPYFYLDRDGSMQLLEKMAMARAGYVMDMHREPNRRCLEDLRANAVSADAATSANEATLAVAAFPRKGEAVDKQRALAVGRTVAFRLKGTNAAWDGQAFRRLNTRVMIPPGMLLVATRLNQLGTPYDDGASDIGLMGAKLLAHRAELAIGLEYDVVELLKKEAFAGKLEILPQAFTATEYYFVFSHEFYAKHADQAENIWNAIAATRRSPEFAAALRRENLPPLDQPQAAK